MMAGSDIANGAASAVTVSSDSLARRSTMARRVGSARAEKARSSWALLRSTMWLSIVAGAAEVKRGPVHDRVREEDDEAKPALTPQ
jgi:hypothetical protein